MSTCDPRFDVNNPNLCSGLRWKGQFIRAEMQSEAPGTGDTSFWCAYTQNCNGPDGMRVEPAMCSTPFRQCHGTGMCG